MPAWRDLSTDDLGALAQAVQALSVTRVEPAPSEALLAQGREVYAANCAQCHGPDGRGNGTAADALPMVPANFTQQQLSLSEAVRVLREGIPGSPMAPWTSRLTSADILATAHYVRSLYAPALPGHLRK
jgi:mono/diheme cytochrome c family protein